MDITNNDDLVNAEEGAAGESDTDAPDDDPTTKTQIQTQTPDGSDTTIQSEIDAAELKAAAVEAAYDAKELITERTLAHIIKEQSKDTSAIIPDTPTTTAARMELADLPQTTAAAFTAPSTAAQPPISANNTKNGTGFTAVRVEDADVSEMDMDQTSASSLRSIGSLACRICHNSENPEKLVSPCLCKGSLTYVHIYCLERWISTSRSTSCEVCQFQYNTQQTLRYTCYQSLRMWYSRSMSRRALQEDCQMFSLLTLVAFGIIGTLLVGIQYYFLQGQAWGIGRLWTKGWLIFFLFTTLVVYFMNIYMIARSQLAPWYRWWQSARDIKLILENRKPFRFRPFKRGRESQRSERLMATSSLQSPQEPAAQPQHDYRNQLQFPVPSSTQPNPPPPPPEPLSPTTAANSNVAAIMLQEFGFV